MKQGKKDKKQPIRKVIKSGDVALPQVLAQFICMHENKAGLALFLANYQMNHAQGVHVDCELVVGGGFSLPKKHHLLVEPT